MKATRNFFEEIIQCLITRRDEWENKYHGLRHKSGVVINFTGGSPSFEPHVDLTEAEKKRLKEVISKLTKLDVLEKIGVQEDGRVPDHDERTLNFKVRNHFNKILQSIYDDPDSWEVKGSTFEHQSEGIIFWANKDRDGSRSSIAGKLYQPDIGDLTKEQVKAVQAAMDQWDRYQFLKKLNEHLPQVDTEARTWGDRCPYCRDRPEAETFRCECGVLVHLECAHECERCPVCNETFELAPPKVGVRVQKIPEPIKNVPGATGIYKFIQDAPVLAMGFAATAGVGLSYLLMMT